MLLCCLYNFKVFAMIAYISLQGGGCMLNVQSNTRSLETFPTVMPEPRFFKDYQQLQHTQKDFLELTFTRNYSVNHEVSLSIPKNIPDNYGAHSSDLTGTHCSQGEVRGGPAAGSRITHIKWKCNHRGIVNYNYRKEATRAMKHSLHCILLQLNSFYILSKVYRPGESDT